MSSARANLIFLLFSTLFRVKHYTTPFLGKRKTILRRKSLHSIRNHLIGRYEKKSRLLDAVDNSRFSCNHNLHLLSIVIEVMKNHIRLLISYYRNYFPLTFAFPWDNGKTQRVILYIYNQQSHGQTRPENSICTSPRLACTNFDHSLLAEHMIS